jgi:N-acetylneuraminate synthase
MSTIIIAEAGVNHNGDIGLAKELIHIAASSGADFVKFQTFQTSNIISPHAPKADYQKISAGTSESQFDMVKKLELSQKDHEILIKESLDCGINFLSTGFDISSIDLILNLGINLIKIPSGEITNLPLLRHIAGKKLPTILSTGMASLGDIDSALNILMEGGISRNEITLLHCNTEYPTPMIDVNLRAMATMRSAFGTPVGYSDHTKGIEVPIAAVALGASVIEKHFTVDRNLPGPDHRASVEPDELRQMVKAIRNIEQALAGDGVKRPMPSELANRLIARKSIVAARQITAGEAFSSENLATKRPGTGISPMRWDDVIGRIAARDYDADEAIEI